MIKGNICNVNPTYIKSILLLISLFLGVTAFAPSDSVIPDKPEDISPLLVGETIPDVSLMAVSGQPTALKTEVAKKPTILVFYRGGWGPYCTTHLAELRLLQPDMDRMGYQMIAISTDAPEGLKGTVDKKPLTYTLFSDADLTATRAFGLASKAPERHGEMLMKSSGGKNTRKLLPVSAFTLETARQKVQLAEDAWNTKDPERVSLAYTPDTEWRNRTASAFRFGGR